MPALGIPLFGEYRDWGKQLPGYEELAKYIFYTETSRDFDRKAMNEKTGKIGEHHGDQLLSALHVQRSGRSPIGHGMAQGSRQDGEEQKPGGLL